MLWADDLILVSESASGLQKQLNALHEFCKRNRMIVNESKTKFVVFGKHKPVTVSYESKYIEQVQHYKYLGVMINATATMNCDIFKMDYKYLADQARKAIFAIQKKIRVVGPLPPHIMFHIFNGMVKPIIAYGAEVWGYNKHGKQEMDKVQLCFLRRMLGVKCTTSNIVTYGECGQLPVSIACDIALLKFSNRIEHMHQNSNCETSI